MVVRNKMNQIEFTTSTIPRGIWVAKLLHIDEIQEEVKDLPDKINSGRTFLKVVAYPWGVEYDVCEGGDEP
jgi:hypothetical protein